MALDPQFEQDLKNAGVAPEQFARMTMRQRLPANSGGGLPAPGAGLNARLISPVPNNQQARNSEDDNRYQPPRNPGFDSDLFGG